MKTEMTKKLNALAVAFLIMMSIVACKKSETTSESKQSEETPTLATGPEASKTEDSKSGGVYKGVFVGSTGYVKIMLQGGTKSVNVTMDGVNKTLVLVSFSPENWTSGEAITNALFAKDDWRVEFSVDANGDSPDVKVHIPNHNNIAVTIVKETSSTQVKVFEGQITYQGNSTNSAFNFVVSGEMFVGQGRMPVEETTYSMFGTVIDSKVNGYINNAAVKGDITGDDATGTIITPNATADWKAKRTL